MNIDEEILDFLNALLNQKTGKSLTPIEEEIFRQSWEGKTYNQMDGTFSGYSINYVERNLAVVLWKRLSKATGKAVTKSNLKIVLEPLIIEYRQNELKGHIFQNRYIITQLLSRRDLSKIYLVEDLHLKNEQCVVKQIICKNNKDATKKFNREVGCLYQLGCHSQISKLRHHFEDEEGYYLVYEFVEGEVLSQKLPEDKPSQPWDEELVIKLLLNILEVLDFVHKQRVIHRNIKPSNLIQRPDGKIVLINFGSVKELGVGRQRTYAGTLGYMAPEQSSGVPKLSSDIYAVAMVGIQAFSGIPPKDFEVNYDTGTVIWRKSTKISQEIAAILHKMAQYDFRNRYDSVGEVLQDMKKLTTIDRI